MDKAEVESLKQLIDDLKRQWGEMWRERFEDRLRAEGVSAKDYADLFVEKGLVIVATRDFRPLTFGEVVGKHVPAVEAQRFVPVDPSRGGWGKFVREACRQKKPCQNSRRRQFLQSEPVRKKAGSSKNGGRGWLHQV